MQAVKPHSSLKPLLGSDEVCPKHNRSRSCPGNRVKEDDLLVHHQVIHHLKLDMRDMKGCIDVDKQQPQSPISETHSSLEEEILQLERHLHDQFAVRRALEKALGYKTSSHDASIENSMPKPTKELIKEIAMLELEVTYLEQYLLSLYRKAFNEQLFSLSPPNNGEKLKSPSILKPALFLKVSDIDKTPKTENSVVQSSQVRVLQNPVIRLKREMNSIGRIEKLVDPGVERCHSSLSYRSFCSIKTSPPMDSLVKDLRSCNSQPLSWLEHQQSAASDVISLAEHLGTQISDHVPETPNRLSEDVIRCMGAIYYKFAEPALMHQGQPSPSFSSTSDISSRDQCDIWSPHCRKESSFDIQMEHPYQVEGLKEFTGPYSRVVELPWICRDNQRLSDVEPMLQNFRSLVHRLEKVDPSRMKNEEKLAFWINIHNALVMHAYLVYGVPQNNLKRGSILAKAAYNVGGHILSAETIQNSVLGCRTQRPGQWFRTFFSPKMKLKLKDYRQSYALAGPEPLLHFALCSGSYSDPVVRVYTAKRVFQELDAAKEYYIHATIGISKEQKILVPKIIESFAKDSTLSLSEIVDMILHYLPETQRITMQRYHQGKCRKSIEWVPHNFNFRYLLSKELVK